MNPEREAKLRAMVIGARDLSPTGEDRCASALEEALDVIEKWRPVVEAAENAFVQNGQRALQNKLFDALDTLWNTETK